MCGLFAYFTSRRYSRDRMYLGLDSIVWCRDEYEKSTRHKTQPQKWRSERNEGEKRVRIDNGDDDDDVGAVILNGRAMIFFHLIVFFLVLLRKKGYLAVYLCFLFFVTLFTFLSGAKWTSSLKIKRRGKKRQTPINDQKKMENHVHWATLFFLGGLTSFFTGIRKFMQPLCFVCYGHSLPPKTSVAFWIPPKKTPTPILCAPLKLQPPKKTTTFSSPQISIWVCFNFSKTELNWTEQMTFLAWTWKHGFSKNSSMERKRINRKVQIEKREEERKYQRKSALLTPRSFERCHFFGLASSLQSYPLSLLSNLLLRWSVFPYWFYSCKSHNWMLVFLHAFRCKKSTSTKKSAGLHTFAE